MSKQRYSIIWQKLALADLIHIIDYIAEDNPRRAESFFLEIYGKVSMLVDHPKMGKVSFMNNVRELVVHKNYIVYYSLQGGFIKIRRVKAAARNLLL